MNLELSIEEFTKRYLTPYMVARIKEPKAMSFYSDWAAAQDGSLDPVSGKPSAIHGKDVSSAFAEDKHRHKATNDPRMPAVNTAAVPAPVMTKKKNRWGDE